MVILARKDIYTKADYFLMRIVNLFLLKVLEISLKILIDGTSGITRIK